MYAISNSSHAELLLLLAEMNRLTGKDNKTINTRRRAKLMIIKLKKCKKQITNSSAVRDGGLLGGISENAR